MKLKIIITSTREGRKGPLVAKWFTKIAQSKFQDVAVLDLAAIDLPLMNEPNHPRLQKYMHDHTKKWSEVINTADAFVIVTPEYNHGYPASLKNALDYLYREWNNKPVAFVSYGGVAGGTRAVQQLKQVIAALSMFPVSTAVHIPFFTNHINEAGEFKGNNMLDKSAEDMLNELNTLNENLKGLRKEK